MAEDQASKLSQNVEALSLSSDASSDPLTPQSTAESTKSSPHQFGSLVSQYTTLPDSVVAHLEKAILYRAVRAFPECHAEYDAINPDFRQNPVVAYEEWLAYWAQWRLLESADVLRNAFRWAVEKGKDTHNYGLYTLLRVALGKTEVFTRGNFSKARDSMREIRRWLRDATMEQYTELEIACIFHYYFLIMAANHVTDNFDHEGFRRLPPTSDEAKLNITQLRENVQSQGRLREARSILHFELGFLTEEKAKQSACQSLLEACRSPSEGEPLWFVESAVKSMLAQSLRRAGDTSSADRETEIASDLLYQAPVDESLNKGHLNIRLDQMKATTYANSQESLKVWSEFCDEESVKADPTLLSTALGKAADAALTLLQATPTLENKATFWDWERRNESMLEQLGDVYFLYMSKVFTGQIALNLFDEFGAILRWQQDFHTKYPDFALWTLIVAGRQGLVLVHVRLGEQEEVMKVYGEISQIMRQRDSFWTEGSGDGEEYSHQNTGDLDMVSKSSTTTKAASAFKPENMREEWFSEWARTGYLGTGRNFLDYTVALGPQLAKGSDPYMTTLMRWLELGIAQNEISETDLEILIMPPELGDGQGNATATTLLERLTPSTLKERMYGPDTDPTRSLRWDKMFSILKEWLLRRAKFNETKRHVLLGRLQVEMLDTVVNTQRHEDTLIEAQRILDLIPVLSNEAQEQFKGTSINWRNIACSAKKNIYGQQNPEALANEEFPEFHEVLEIYQISLQESRDRGSLTNEAATLLFIAQHYFFAAWRLRPAAIQPFFEHLDAADTAYNKIRESWKVLKGWAKVEKLLGAVQEQMRNTIAPLAISVICRFPDENARASGLWTIIQMAKSNGLGWLMRTNDPTQQRTAVDIERLDVDFEELPILMPADLKPLTEDVASDVVYVDWYNGSFVGREVPNPIMVTLSSDGSLKDCMVPMTWKKINAVLDDFSFDESDLRKDVALTMLQKLNPLVEALATSTRPGQTLVFSSIGSLHRLPLHALTVDGEILIRRNPIVYCSSLTVLNVVFKARKATERAENFLRHPFQASLFGDPPSLAGKKALNSLAKKLACEAQTGDTSTSSKFTAAILKPSLNLLHYHGHVTFQEGDAKDHGLELDDRRFTLRDVFELAPLPNAYHATLLGCGSGMSKTTASNDVVGLVLAFLYSGVASTVSALWPFADKDAAMYTMHFYEDFDKILQGGKEGVVDLAKANQKAVLAIMDKRPILYHWAPFVLNGYWMMQVPQRR